MRQILLVLLFVIGMAQPAHAAEVQSDGLAVHYAAQGSGPAIILVHGWTCDETSWAAQVAALSGKYRVITLDLPGHGKSAVPARDKFSMKRFADAVEAVRAAVGVDKAVLVGHSMGAVVIRQYALSYPQHVAGLVAADGPLDVRAFAAIPNGGAPLTLDARKAMIEGMFVPETPATMRAQILKTMLGTPDVTANGAGYAMFDAANQSKQIITIPALSVFAGKTSFPQDGKTAEMLSDWKGTQIAGTGHFLMMEKPAEFNRLLTDFVTTRARY